MKHWLLAAALVCFGSSQLRAQNAISGGAVPAQTVTTLGAAASGANSDITSLGSGNIGIGTTGPQTKLDVNGTFQAGSGATKSTFSATGALTLASGAAFTASGANGFIIGGSSITTTGLLTAANASIGGAAVSATGDVTLASNGDVSVTGASGFITAQASVTGSGFYAQSSSVTTAAYFGVVVATQTAGATGALVTATCPANTNAFSGGCNCTGTAVGTVTIIINGPAGTWTAGGSMATGWSCQSADSTTGQTCAAVAYCSKIRN